MNKLACLLVVVLLSACTKDMTEIVDAAEIDGTNSVIEVLSSANYLDYYDWPVVLHEFGNERLLLAYRFPNITCHYINMQSGSIEQSFNTKSAGIPATKDYFLHKQSNNKVQLLNKDNHEVASFNSGSAVYQVNSFGFGFVRQFESNTFVGYWPGYNSGKTVVSYTNGQVKESEIYYNADNSEPLTELMPQQSLYLNEEYLFLVNIEYQQTGGGSYKNYLNKYNHSLQLVDKLLLGTSTNPNWAGGGGSGAHYNPRRFFPNNDYDNLIISTSQNFPIVTNWKIMDNNFQEVGTFSYNLNLNDNDFIFRKIFITSRGEIVEIAGVQSNEFSVFDIHTSLQKTYKITEEFDLPNNSEAYILSVVERRAGGFYVLYRCLEKDSEGNNINKAKLQVIKE